MCSSFGGEIRMTKKERAALVCEKLNEEFGTDIKCSLDFEPGVAWQLLFATIMSAQCTDARVNEVTKTLFVKYPSLEAFAHANLSEMEQDIKSTGFFHNKARNIIACAHALLDRYDGQVPRELDDLVSLPGVGRKTANVIRGNIFGDQSIVVDTHVKRISKLLGLTKEEEPTKVELDLMKCVPKEQWILYNHQIIALGRTVCIARRPHCENCVLQEACKHYHDKEMKAQKK